MAAEGDGVNLRGDRLLLQAKLDIVRQNFRVLDEIEAEGHAAFRKDLRSYLASKHALQEAAEATLDAAAHLIAANGFRRGQDYKDLFRVLTREGVLEEDLAARLEKMAGFRNVLVHRYAEVDPERVWAVLTSQRQDLLGFFEAVFGWMD